MNYHPIPQDQLPNNFRALELGEWSLLRLYLRDMIQYILENPDDDSYEEFIERMCEDEIWGQQQEIAVEQAEILANTDFIHNENVRHEGWEELLDDYYIYPWYNPISLLHIDPNINNYFMAPRQGDGEQTIYTELFKLQGIFEGGVIPREPVPVNPHIHQIVV
jgi:hypothetical protein